MPGWESMPLLASPCDSGLWTSHAKRYRGGDRSSVRAISHPQGRRIARCRLPAARGTTVTYNPLAANLCIGIPIAEMWHHHLDHSLQEEARGTMSKPKHKKRSSRPRPAKPGARRMAVLTVTVVLKEEKHETQCGKHSARHCLDGFL